jgi:hypothetical protein
MFTMSTCDIGHICTLIVLSEVGQTCMNAIEKEAMANKTLGFLLYR